MDKNPTSTSSCKGLVLRCIGNNCRLLLDSGLYCDAIVKGNLRLKGIRSTNPVVVGDRVKVRLQGEGESEVYYITEIIPRKNYIIRKAANLSKESHILAANIDIALLLVTLKSPETSTIFVDRFLATAEAYNIPVVLIFNKVDLFTKEEFWQVEQWEKIYHSIGYKSYRISVKEKIGIEQLYSLIGGKTVLLSGHSGVGKSSLINALLPENQLRTQSVSQSHGTGLHTTTLSEMIAIDPQKGGGYIIDSPGIKGFGTLEMNKANTAHFFPEFFEESKNCRFNNCTHINEPSCAVLQAIEEGRISNSRYISYLSILEDQEESKYRKDI